MTALFWIGSGLVVAIVILGIALVMEWWTSRRLALYSDLSESIRRAEREQK